MLMIVLQTMEQGGGPDRAELEQLLAGVAVGKQEALAELYRKTRAAVYAMALSCLKHTHDAQDVTQDTFVRIWESAPGYRAQGSPMAWILTIARNLALMRLRQSSRYVELEAEEWDAIPAQASDLSVEERHLLQEALAALTDEERQIVLLHAVSGLKHREIAAVLGRPLATVLSKYHRALKKLRAKLEGDDAL